MARHGPKLTATGIPVGPPPRRLISFARVARSTVEARWQKALAQVLRLTDVPLRKAGVQWALVGSAATALQGCAVTPGDLDWLFLEPGGVDVFARLMAPFAPTSCPSEPGTDSWVSTKAAPIADGPDPSHFEWRWGRWYVQGFKVEAANIRAPDGIQGAEPGIWENGPRMWPHSRRVAFGPWKVRVPPLEVQLATSARRGLTDRTEAIVQTLHHVGTDERLLNESLGGDDLRGLLARFSTASA